MFFLTRRNEGKPSKDREHLIGIGATSGDTGRQSTVLEVKRISRCSYYFPMAELVRYKRPK